MPRQIWNEGRVVGYSAYELYVKHALSVDPEHEPVSEREWLASMLAMGSSMLLRVGADPSGSTYNGLHYRDIQFPTDCRLCAANTIMASLFDGDGYVGADSTDATLTVWATKVTSYGSLIDNTSSSSPNGTVKPTGAIPPASIKSIDNKELQSKIREYTKIVDGIIIQPGTWETNPNEPPYKDFKPTLSEYPRLRIAFSERVTKPFFLLLTGFTNRTVVTGFTGFESAVNTQSPADGDFLGPLAFPWSAKVIFSMPPSFVNFFMSNKYRRKLPISSSVDTVNSDPIIDMSTTDPRTYYDDNNEDALVDVEVEEINSIGEDSSVLTIYQKASNLPPALFGSKISKRDGESELELDSSGSFNNVYIPLGAICYIEDDDGNIVEHVVSKIFSAQTNDYWKTGIHGVYNAIIDKYGETSLAATLVELNSAKINVGTQNLEYRFWDWSKYENVGYPDEPGYMSLEAAVSDFENDYSDIQNTWTSSVYGLDKDGERTNKLEKVKFYNMHNCFIRNWTSNPSTYLRLECDIAWTTAQYLYVEKSGARQSIKKFAPFDNVICPIDTIAPGSLKMYDGESVLSDSTSKARMQAMSMQNHSNGVHAFVRDAGDKGSHVVYEYNQYDDLVPVSDNYVASLYGSLSSTDVVLPYFSQIHNAGYAPNYVGFDCVGNRRLFGNLSEKFRKDFGIEYYDDETESINPRLRALLDYGINLSMYNQIPNEDKNKYYYILRSLVNYSTANGSYWTLIPVRIKDGHLDYIEKVWYSGDNSPNSLQWVSPPYTVCEGKYYTNLGDTDGDGYDNWGEPTKTWTNDEIASWGNTSPRLNYLGTWWNSTNHLDGHQYIGDYLPDTITNNSFIVDKQRDVPIAASGYSSWEEMYEKTNLSDIFSSEELSSLYSEYRSFTLAELARTAKTHDIHTGKYLTYTQNGKTYNGRNLTTYIAKNDFDYSTPNFLKNVKCDSAFSAKITDSNAERTVLVPIPHEYQKTDGPLAAVGISGNNQTQSLSMANAYGELYDIFGLSGVMHPSEFRDGMLHWDDLVQCLASGKSLDFLGPILRGIIATNPASLESMPEGDYIIRKSQDASGKPSIKLVKQ